MNLLKTLGLGMYYRMRRIGKAMKNWKKFGVVIFGSMFLAGSMFPGLSHAAEVLRVEIYRNNQAISSLIVDANSQTQFTVKAFLGTTDVTSSTNFVWAIDGKYQISDVGSINSAGLYKAGNTDGFYSGAVRVMGVYSGGGSDSDSVSITINAVNPPANTLAVSISPNTAQTVAVNQPVVFTPSATWNGGTAKTGTNIDWYVGGIKQTTSVYPATYSFSKAVAGTYQVSAKARYNPGTGEVTSGFSNITSVTVTSAPPATRLDHVEIYRNNQAISSLIVDAHTQTQFTVKAFDTNGGDITSGTSFTWAINGLFQIGDVGSVNNSGLYTAGGTQGFYSGAIKVMGIYGGVGGGSDSDSVSITINPVTPPQQQLVIDINPTGTTPSTIGTPVPFTPHVTWNGGPALSGTTVTWYVDGQPKSTLSYPTPYSFVGTTVGTHSIYAIAHYTTVDSNQSNISYVNIPATQSTWDVEIDQAPNTLQLVNGFASRDFSYTATYTSGPLIGSPFSPTQWNWTVVSGQGVINGQTGLYTATAETLVTIKITAWDASGHTEDDTLTFNVVSTPEDVRYLHSMSITPMVWGPMQSGGYVDYIAHGFDQHGVELTGNITFNWTVLNGTIGNLASTTTGYGQANRFNTHPWAVSGTYYPVTASATYTASNNVVYTLYNLQNPQLILTQVIISDVMTHVTAVANPASILVGGQLSTLTAQAYSNNSPLNSNVTYAWTKISGPTNFVNTSFGQSVQVISDSQLGTATYQVTATYTPDGTTKTAQVQVTVNPVSSHTLTVNITPDPAYAQPNTNVGVYATVLYDGVDVTGSSFIDWTMLNTNAGYLAYENQANATIRTGSTVNTFPSAVQVYATYNNLSATDLGTVVVTTQSNPVYWLDWTLNGVIEDGSAACEGDVIVYTLTLANNRTTTVNNVQVSLDVPANTTFVSAASAVGAPRIFGRTVTWDAGTFVSGSSKTMTMRVTIGSGAAKNRVTIKTNGRVTASEIAGFGIASNSIRVLCGGTTPTDEEPLPSTGTDAIALGILAVVALGLATLAYRLMNQKTAQHANMIQQSNIQE